MKLELEVTLTPEPEVTSSTVMMNNCYGGDSSSDQGSGEDCKSLPANSGICSAIPTVIPPTTIVCLPSLVTTMPSSVSGAGHPHTTYINQLQHHKQHIQQQQQQPIFTHNGAVQRPSMSVSLPPISAGQQPTRAAVVASSSSLPYLSLATNQPLRAVPQQQNRLKGSVTGGVQTQQTAPSSQQQQQQQLQKGSGRGSRTSNRPPPGAVNLERSYQICQAVIQNSPNRHQLKAQLRLPPSMLATGTSPNSYVAATTIKKDDASLATSNKIVSSSETSFWLETSTFLFFSCSNQMCSLAWSLRERDRFSNSLKLNNNSDNKARFSLGMCLPQTKEFRYRWPFCHPDCSNKRFAKAVELVMVTSPKSIKPANTF